MKKIFMSKSLIAKIALVLAIIILLEFTISSRPVQAASLGGTLLNPIVNLVVYLADGVIQIIQSALTDIEESFHYIDITKEKKTFWVAIGTCIAGILIIAVAGLVIYLTAGAATPAVVAAVSGVVGGVAGTGATAAIGAGVYLAFYNKVGKKVDAAMFGTQFVYSTIYITPETLLKNQIQLFNVNFFKDVGGFGNDTTASLSSTLRRIIAQTYNTIRDIALVAMLIVIIYIAIRLLTALNPREKSRYKESIVNCLVGFVLIIFMHYGMSLSVNILEQITNTISISDNVYDIGDNPTEEEIQDYVTNHPELANKALAGVCIEIEGEQLYNKVIETDDAGNKKAIFPGMQPSKTEENTVEVRASNFTEQARYMAQKLYKSEGEGEEKTTVETWEHIGWSFVYIMLVILTIAFVIMYGKRFLYMAVLTMFAPIVGVMYPINRVNGSRAQTLNLWFKEYFGNLIIQPFHLLLYTIFIGSAMTMALENPIYVIIAIMGLIMVENLLKDLLGIQDTRIGSLGKSLQDTTRAIKTTEKAATSIARTVGRTISRVGNTIGRGVVAGAALAGGIKSKNIGEGSEEEGSEESNSGVRLPTNQQPAELGGGMENPLGIEQHDSLPAVATANPNSNANPTTDPIANPNANPITDPNANPTTNPNANPNIIDVPFREVAKEPLNGPDSLDNPMVAENKPLGIAMNDNTIDDDIGLNEGDTNGIGLNEENFGRVGLNEKNDTPDFLETSTLDMVDELNEGNDKVNFTTIDGELDNNNIDNSLNAGYEELVRTDGERGIYKDNSGNLRLDRVDSPNRQGPMAMEMAVGSENNYDSNIGGLNNNTILTDNNTMDLDYETASAGNLETPPSNGGNTSSYVSGGGSRSVLDSGGMETVGNNNSTSSGDNIRVAWENPNEPEPSSESRPEFTTIEGGRSASGMPRSTSTSNTLGNTSSEKIDISTSDNFEGIPDIRENIGGTRQASSSGITLEQPSESVSNNYEGTPNIRENTGGTRQASSSGITLEQPSESVSSNYEGTPNIRENTGSTRQASSSGTTLEQPSESVSNNYEGTPNIRENTGSTRQASSSGTTLEQPSESVSSNYEVASNVIENTGSTRQASSSTTNSQQVHRLTPDEYEEIPPVRENIGSESQSGSNRNSQRSTRSAETQDYTRTDNTGAGSEDYRSYNISNNNEREQSNSNIDTAKIEKIANGIGKGLGVAETVTGRTVGAVGTAVNGVIDTALNAVSGNVGGAAGSVVDSTLGVVSEISGVSLGSSGGRASSSTSSSRSTGRPSQNIQTIMKESGLSERDARIVENGCKTLNINDDRNMALIGRVWKQIPSADQKWIFRISHMLIELKRDGRSLQEAEKVLQQNANVSKTTKELLLRMYKNLYVS